MSQTFATTGAVTTGAITPKTSENSTRATRRLLGCGIVSGTGVRHHGRDPGPHPRRVRPDAAPDQHAEPGRAVGRDRWEALPERAQDAAELHVEQRQVPGGELFDQLVGDDVSATRALRSVSRPHGTSGRRCFSCGEINAAASPRVRIDARAVARTPSGPVNAPISSTAATIRSTISRSTPGTLPARATRRPAPPRPGDGLRAEGDESARWPPRTDSARCSTPRWSSRTSVPPRDATTPRSHSMIRTCSTTPLECESAGQAWSRLRESNP